MDDAPELAAAKWPSVFYERDTATYGAPKPSLISTWLSAKGTCQPEGISRTDDHIVRLEMADGANKLKFHTSWLHTRVNTKVCNLC